MPIHAYVPMLDHAHLPRHLRKRAALPKLFRRFLKTRRDQHVISHIRSIGLFVLWLFCRQRVPQAASRYLTQKELSLYLLSARQSPRLQESQFIGHAAVKRPVNFASYALESYSGNLLCHVPTVTDDNGINQKPIVYAENAKEKKVLWVKQLSLPPDNFQSRATHCASSGNTHSSCRSRIGSPNKRRRRPCFASWRPMPIAARLLHGKT